MSRHIRMSIPTGSIWAVARTAAMRMTMNMVIQYPDYFAAAYPICEAYAYYEYERKSDGTYVKTDDEATGTSAFVKTEQVWFTEEKIQAIKDLPIWLVQSADDPVVVPANYLLPTYQAYRESEGFK